MHSVLFTKQPGLLKQYKQHVPQQGAGHGQGAPWAPTPTSRGPRREALSSAAASKLRKEGIFSLREVARIRNTEMWALQISVDQQMNRIFISPKSITVGVGGIPIRGRWGATWSGLGQELPVPVGSGPSAHMDGYRGASTRCHHLFLYKREWILQANYALFHGWKESKEV